MGLIDVHVPQTRVDIDLRKVEANLERLGIAQEKELPKIRSALEVLAGVKSKKLAKLEHRLELLEEIAPYTDFLEDMPEDYKEAVHKQELVQSEINELRTKIAFGVKNNGRTNIS